MNKNDFTRKDLKVGYVVELKCGTILRVEEVGTRGSLILCTYPHGGKDNFITAGWAYLSRWNNDLTASGNMMLDICGIDSDRLDMFDVIAVYGYMSETNLYKYSSTVLTTGRPLLWSRVEPREMTVAEISKELGYPVKIVADKED